MCGIVGYIGRRNALPVVIEALKRLEYRGYDSSGCALIHENELQVYKKNGKIIELERSLPEPSKCTGSVAIAHTRWATHGEPNELNAHERTICYDAGQVETLLLLVSLCASLYLRTTTRPEPRIGRAGPDDPERKTR